tara:strand:- start:132 stop:338 length:207 start_codon:yes stop_codon:yes gene_type:complete
MNKENYKNFFCPHCSNKIELETVVRQSIEQDLLSKYKSDWEKTKIEEIEAVRINEKLKAKKKQKRSQR